jgi:hypothetical protein
MQLRTTALPLLVVTLFPLAACSLVETDRPAPPVLIQTDREVYQRGPGPALPPSVVEPIRLRLQNVSPEPVHYEAPTEWITLERRVGGGWQNLGAWYALLAVAPRFHTLGPGERADALATLDPNDEIVPGPGEYRFRLDLYADPQAR